MKNDLARINARYDLMSSIAHRKNYWCPKPSRHKSEAIVRMEEEIQALIDGEYIFGLDCPVKTIVSKAEGVQYFLF